MQRKTRLLYAENRLIHKYRTRMANGTKSSNAVQIVRSNRATLPTYFIYGQTRSDRLLGGATQFFSLIQAQNLQAKCLVIFKSGESLIFVVFFFLILCRIYLESTFVKLFFNTCVLKVTLVVYLIFH
jgi:hypothetical protein